MKYRPDIDGLRAIAILSVVTFHAFPDLLGGGFTGVDVFFVISGFLISNIILTKLNDGDFSFLDFYKRRAKRILPALLIVLITTFILGYGLLLNDEFQALAKHITTAATFTSNFTLWSEAGYFDTAADTKILLHLWSLSVEEQFYILWPLLLFSTRKAHINTACVIIVCCTASFYANIHAVGTDRSMAFYFPHTRFWEMILGGLLAQWSLRAANAAGYSQPRIHTVSNAPYWNRRALANVRSLIGSTLLIISFCYLRRDSSFPGYWALLPVVGTCLIIQGGPDTWINRRVLSTRVLTWIGLISYPLYLWHWPLLSLARIIECGTPPWPIRASLVVLSFLLAWLTYRLIERPIRSMQNGRTALLLGLALLITGSAGALAYTLKPASLRQALFTQHTSQEKVLSRYDHLLAGNPGYFDEMANLRQTSIRARSCHLRPERQYSDYAATYRDNCLKLDSQKKNVLIIGDSHAGDLYAALHEAYGDINFLQATGAGCTAMRSYYKDKSVDCYRLIDGALEYAAHTPVDAVILASRWPADFENIAPDIRRLKQAGRNVILVGPPAEFTEDVMKFLARRSPDTTLAALSQEFINANTLQLNQRMRDFSDLHALHFIDRIAIFCDAANVCQLLADDGQPYIFDYGHLLPRGSEFLGHRLAQMGALSAMLKTRSPSPE